MVDRGSSIEKSYVPLKTGFDKGQTKLLKSKQSFSTLRKFTIRLRCSRKNDPMDLREIKKRNIQLTNETKGN